MSLVENIARRQIQPVELGYLAKLFGNPRITRYLTQHHADIFRELQAASEAQSLEG